MKASSLLAILLALAPLSCWAQSLNSTGTGPTGGALTPDGKLPSGVLLVKGAWSSASDSETPLPESGSIVDNIYTNRYFGLSYPLPAEWIERSAGPPPSDSGRYGLTLLTPSAAYKGPGRGSILIAAQDLFFTPEPLAHTLDLLNYTKGHLQADYKLEQDLTDIKIAGRQFSSFAYWSPSTELHWRVLATEIRCHTVEFFFMNRDPQTLERLVQQASKMNLAAAGTTANQTDEPVCIRSYAIADNLIERMDPVFPEHRFNPVPVRIIIDKDGKVRHIHFLNAFPDQTEAITEALAHWKFKPYLRDGKPVEVETGIMFGRALQPAVAAPDKPKI
jgi:hypothetical protein